MSSSTEYQSLMEKNDNKKSKLVGLLFLLILCAVLYWSFHASSNAKNNIFINELEATLLYPSPKEIEAYRAKKVVIEYDISELPLPNHIMFPESDGMERFHNELMGKRGVNPDDHNIQWRVTNKESIISSDIDTLDCDSNYAYSYSSGYLEVECDSGYSVTGCISYEPYTDGNRWGDVAYDGTDCYTYALDTSFTSISARCCKVDGAATLTTDYTSYSSQVSGDYCVWDECGYGSVATGCGVVAGCCGFVSWSSTPGFSGSQRTERDYNSFEYSGCKGQRSDAGYLWVSPYCATLSSGNLDCYTIEASTSEISSTTDQFSMVTCEDNEEYVLTDCNAQVYNDINACSSGPAAIDWGVAYGGWMYGDYCATRGEYNIIASATCCKIE